MPECSVYWPHQIPAGNFCPNKMFVAQLGFCPSRRQGKEYTQSYAKGVPLMELQEKELTADTSRTGTQVQFLFDKSVFSKM